MELPVNCLPADVGDVEPQEDAGAHHAGLRLLEVPRFVDEESPRWADPVLHALNGRLGARADRSTPADDRDGREGAEPSGVLPRVGRIILPWQSASAAICHGKQCLSRA